MLSFREVGRSDEGTQMIELVSSGSVAESEPALKSDEGIETVSTGFSF